MSWQRMSYPVGAESLAIGPLYRLHVHPPDGYVSFWRWWVETGPEGIVRPGEATDPRRVARELAEEAALAWTQRSLRALEVHQAAEVCAANLHGRARQRAMPWFWMRDRLVPAFTVELPIRVWIERGVDECRWYAGPERGTACMEALARSAATSAAFRLLRRAQAALGDFSPWTGEVAS